jgi:DNA-binding GntR family transcriptional regulator
MPAFGQAQPEPAGTLARHRVREGVQQMILSGQFQPGQRLVQQELAQRFGVAQSVVRESLLELQFCGLVEAVDNLGMFVSGLGPQPLLEGLAARLCCEKASRTDIRELTDLAERTYRLGREGKLEAMSAADRQFHYRMVQASGNRLLEKLTEGYRVLGMFVRANRDIRQVRDEHLEVIEAIAGNRPAEAERLARRHVRAARQAVEKEVADGTFVAHFVDEEENAGPDPLTKDPLRQTGSPPDVPPAPADRQRQPKGEASS